MFMPERLYMEILSETHANVSRDFISRIIFSRKLFFALLGTEIVAAQSC